MPFTQADVDALKLAIATGRGAKTVRFADQEVTFHSLDEMLRLLTFMETEVAGIVAAETGVVTTRYAATSKGC